MLRVELLKQLVPKGLLGAVFIPGDIDVSSQLDPAALSTWSFSVLTSVSGSMRMVLTFRSLRNGVVWATIANPSSRYVAWTGKPAKGLEIDSPSVQPVNPGGAAELGHTDLGLSTTLRL
jgi:hypothetical protein